MVNYSEEVVESNERKAKVNTRVKSARVVIEDDIGMLKWQFLPLLMGITAHSVSAASDLIMVRFFYEADPIIFASNVFHNIHLIQKCTGCKSRIRKMFEFKIRKKTILVLKQTTPQQKALDISFNLAP